MAKNKSNNWSMALLRVVLGIIFFYHGYVKLFVTGGFSGTVEFFSSLGIPAAGYSALLVSAIEFFGGIFLILGIVTKWSSVLLFINMLVAFFVVHYGNGFSVARGGYEFVLLLMAGLVAVISMGPGKMSMGRTLKSKHLQ